MIELRWKGHRSSPAENGTLQYRLYHLNKQDDGEWRYQWMEWKDVPFVPWDVDNSEIDVNISDAKIEP